MNSSASISSPDMILTQESAKSKIQQELAAQSSGVTLRSVTKKYGSFTAVQDINLDVPPGSYTCLLGPSGCGKTTTLRMIAGHEDITSGDLLIGDRRVNDLPPAKRNSAMMFQSYALFPHKTVWENVDFGLKMRNVPPAERSQRVNEMIEIVGLSQFADRKPAKLSGGQQQRAALARALVTRPQVLLLDEPLSALDENLRVKTRGELRRLQKQFGMTFIQVTHGQDEAFSLSDQIVVMDNGRIDQIGAPADIFRTPASRFVARFVGDNNIFSGRVSGVALEQKSAVIRLEVEGIGTFFCRGQAANLGMEAACCVRSDSMDMMPYPPTDPTASNQLTARIMAIEFTGYITRVSLVVETTGQEITYKVRSSEWVNQAVPEGQLVTLTWAADECVFLSH
jgi:putative spermidine/putrescine transport system ATP-binding protein